MQEIFTILVADDEPSIRNGIKNILFKQFGYDVDITLASDGEEAWKLFQKKNPDLVISDIVMPVKTGLQLVMDIRDSGSDVPVILLSGYDDFIYAQKAIQLKVANYLVKPLKKDELIREVDKVKNERSEKKKIEKVDYNRFIESARGLFIRRLLLGELKSQEEIDRTYKNLDMDFFRDFATVVLVRSSEDDAKLLKDTLKKEFSDRYIYIEIADNKILVSNSDEKHTRHDISIMLELFAGHSFQFVQGCTIGSNPKNLYISYKTALLASSYSIYAPDERYIDQSVIKEESPRSTTADIDTESLKDLMLIGTDEEIIKWIESFMEKLFYIPTPPPSYLKGMCIFLINDVERLLVNTSNIPRELLPQIDASRFNDLRSVEKIKDKLISTFLSIRHDAIPQSIIANDSVIHKTKKYIEAHIQENISLSDIATYLNMNTTYFSTYFKLKTGENFRSYLSNRKNKYAKSLLSDPELTIEEIAQKLGYTDYRSFHRIFKNLNGITPTEFRKQMKGIYE